MLLVTVEPKGGVGAEKNEEQFGQPIGKLGPEGTFRFAARHAAEYVTRAAPDARLLRLPLFNPRFASSFVR